MKPISRYFTIVPSRSGGTDGPHLPPGRCSTHRRPRAWREGPANFRPAALRVGGGEGAVTDASLCCAPPPGRPGDPRRNQRAASTPCRTRTSQAAGDARQECATPYGRHASSRPETPPRHADGTRPAATLASGGELLATLATARRNDRAARAGPHPQAEAMLAVPAAIVRLVRTLAHGNAPLWESFGPGEPGWLGVNPRIRWFDCHRSPALQPSTGARGHATGVEEIRPPNGTVHTRNGQTHHTGPP